MYVSDLSIEGIRLKTDEASENGKSFPRMIYYYELWTPWFNTFQTNYTLITLPFITGYVKIITMPKCTCTRFILHIWKLENGKRISWSSPVYNWVLTLARGLPPVAAHVNVKLAPSAYDVVRPFFTKPTSSLTWTLVGGTV